MNPPRRTSSLLPVATLVLAISLAMTAWQCRPTSSTPATSGETPPTDTTVPPAADAPLAEATPPQAVNRLLAGSIPLLATDMTEVDLSEAISPPAVLLYFSTSCPHCWNVAGEFQESCDRLVSKGIQCAAVVSSSSRLSAARDFAEQTGLTSTLYLDYAGRFRTTYEMVATPTALVFDASGEIVLRADPYYRGASLELEMLLAEQAGESKDSVWRQDVYYGARPCSVCHDVAYNSWLLSSHSLAIMHLGDDSYEDPACQRCHATAAGQTGGFTSLEVTGHLRDVGCESCHGPAGGHGPEGLRPDRANPRDSCATCHDEDHSIVTDFESLVPALDHGLAGSLPREQWNARRLELEEGRFDHLGTAIPTGDTIGSKACDSCHAAEFAAWASGPHAAARETLREQHSHKDEACLTCHVPPETYSNPGQRARETGVGCEVCHGPGADHAASEDGSVPPPGLRKNHALECVVEPVCRRCHTTLRDPDWERTIRMAGIHAAGSIPTPANPPSDAPAATTPPPVDGTE